MENFRKLTAITLKLRSVANRKNENEPCFVREGEEEGEVQQGVRWKKGNLETEEANFSKTV